MNKHYISVCLEEAMFDNENQVLQESFGAAVAKGIGGVIKTAAGTTLYRKGETWVKDHQKEKTIPEKIRNIELPKQATANIGKNVGKGVAGLAGAVLLYKGIKALYNKLKKSDNPKEQAALKSQIDSKKSQLKKVKSEKG